MSKKVVLGTVIFVIAVSALLFSRLSGNKSSSETQNQKVATPVPLPSEVNYLASFVIFTNGTKRNFSNPMYHNLSSDVYITSDDPEIVHVRKRGITWGQFFATLPMELTTNCLTTGTGQKFCSNEGGTLKFYINGKRVDNFLTHEVENGEQALISFGKETFDQLTPQIEESLKEEVSEPYI